MPETVRVFGETTCRPVAVASTVNVELSKPLAVVVPDATVNEALNPLDPASKMTPTPVVLTVPEIEATLVRFVPLKVSVNAPVWNGDAIWQSALENVTSLASTTGPTFAEPRKAPVHAPVPLIVCVERPLNPKNRCEIVPLFMTEAPLNRIEPDAGGDERLAPVATVMFPFIERVPFSVRTLVLVSVKLLMIFADGTSTPLLIALPPK